MNFAVWLSNNLAGGDDGKVKVWSTDTGFCYVTFNEHTAPVSDVYFRPNGNVLLSASLDGTVRAFDLYRYVIKKARDNTLDWACKELHSLTSPHYGATEATLLITLRYNMWQFSNSFSIPIDVEIASLFEKLQKKISKEWILPLFVLKAWTGISLLLWKKTKEDILYINRFCSRWNFQL